jgi:nucleotide-binding universal stress UspA family protein
MVTPERPIVAAIDFSPASNRALEWAVELARTHHARLLLVHSVPRLDSLGDSAGLSTPESLVLEARRALEGVAASIRARVPQVSYDVACGPPTRHIVDVATATKAQLVVMGTRGLRGWRHALLGSNAERVIGHAPCPVLAVHAEDPLPREKPWTLLFATDFSSDAEHAIEAALGCCADVVAGVVIVHAFQMPPVIPASEMATWALYEGARNDRGSRLERATAALGRKVPTSALLRDGDVPLVVNQAITDVDADVVVIGSRGEGGIAHLLMGSNAARVAQTATRPVFVLPRRAWTALLEHEADAAALAADEQC